MLWKDNNNFFKFVYSFLIYLEENLFFFSSRSYYIMEKVIISFGKFLNKVIYKFCVRNIGSILRIVVFFF